MPSASARHQQICAPCAAPDRDRAHHPVSDGSRSGGFANVAKAKLCSECAMRKVCVPSEMNSEFMPGTRIMFHMRRRIRMGQHLYRSGEASDSIYAVRSGFIKTSALTDDGREQVTGFHMMGEVIGVDT